MSKPTETLEWAETPVNPTDVVEPATIRAAGYPDLSPLPYNHLNWLLRAFSRTASWVRGLFNNDGELTLGAEHAILRVSNDNAVVNEWEFDGAAINSAKVDILSTRQLALSALLADAITIEQYGALDYTEDATDATWHFLHADGGEALTRSDAHRVTSTAAPASPLDTLTAKNICRLKAVVELTVDGSGGFVSSTILESYNVDSAARTGDELRITASTAAPNPVVQWQIGTDGGGSLFGDENIFIAADSQVANAGSIFTCVPQFLVSGAWASLLDAGGLTNGNKLRVYLTVH